MKDRPEPFLTLSKQTIAAPYHKLFSSITDVVCVFDEQGIFRYISPVAVQLFGYKPEEMIGCSFLNFIHPDDAARSTQDFKSKAVPGEKMYFENCFVRKNGTAVSVIWSRRWDPTERLFYCIARDGSEKYETEQRLLKAQQMAGVANYEFDLIRNCYLYTSDTMFEIFGIDKQKHPVFTFGLFWNSLHPEDRPAVKKDILIDERSKRSTLEYRIIRPGGEVVYVSSIREIICGADGTPLKTIGTIQDITDRKNSELAVKQSEERFRCLVQNSNDLIGIVDADGVYRFVGENVQRHLGYKPEELTGMNCLSFIHPEDAHWVASALQNAATKNVLTIGPYRFRSGEDKWRWIETIVSNQLQNPAIQGLIINSRDVTEKTYKEEERRRYKERIREQSRTMVEVLEQMRDGFLTITMEGKVIYWNREAEKISVKPRKTMLGKSLWDLFPGIRETPYYDLYLQLLEDPKPIQKEIFSPFTKRWLELHAYRTQKRISVFFRDITPGKVAEEELQKLSLIA
ncbi:MAG TPA: PAS domain S-box protein, partial [Flavisolibacter sp.]|nr:PAS domain S-box protein [Flavisolibacter sp.]